MKGMVVVVLTLLVAVLVACVATKKNKSQGIEGNVYMVTGNQMPSPDLKPTPSKGVKTKVYIYELTNMSQAAPADEAAFYKTISTKLVKEIESDDKGYFKTYLDPGTYSLFVKEKDLFYANLSDGKNNINPVVVEAGKMTKLTFNITYKAVY